MRALVIAFGFFVAQMGYAQAVQAKHLVMTIGGGAGVLSMTSERKDLEDRGVDCGALRFAFGYALSDRWSLGIHYDRIGTAFHNGILEHLHLTTYQLEGSFRPWIGARGAWECTIGIGGSAMALFPYGARLPYTGNGAVLSLSTRYLHMFSGTLGCFVAADHASAKSDALVVNGGTVDPDGSATHVQWNSQRLAAGLLVRF